MTAQDYPDGRVAIRYPVQLQYGELIVHTRECAAVDAMHSPNWLEGERKRDLLGHHDWAVCKRCDGFSASQGGYMAKYDLSNMDPEELGLTPMNER